MKIIILGAGGFLGCTLAVAARREGVSVIGIGRSEIPPLEGVFEDWISADVAKLGVAGVDWHKYGGAAVFHLAANTRIHGTGTDLSTTSVAMARAAANVACAVDGRLMFFSSSAVYSGEHTSYPVRLITESDPTEPKTDYGKAKLEAEKVILATCADATVLRIFSAVGDGLFYVPDRGHLVQAVARAIRLGGEMVLRVDAAGLPAVRDYVSVDDVCRLALQWVRCGRGAEAQKFSGIFNFCSGVAVSTEALVAAAECAAAHAIPVRFEVSQTNQNQVMVGCPEKLERIFGWRPRSAIETFWFDCLLDSRDGALELGR